ncbi:hypothetical protein DMH04_37685 [Kibdelosporangium aridum]|uniref:Excreted virulence factor EspC, type VII ESX diderm n=1 Tax=Kibdelosporangium aridum TaxID=2030 RepID=A0A428YYM3_KIBAR|nr:hypothetical protein [Kibdelosporangium aridum]RSM75865.1 hypothetical protein DMH04_37685 [Kibdelosporangium aridum]
MGTGYAVIIDEIRRASTAADDAAEIASKVDVAGAIGPVGQALPGSKSADSVNRLMPYWKNEVTSWTADAKAYAANLSSAADRYEQNEQAAAADFRTGGTRGGMRAE